MLDTRMRRYIEPPLDRGVTPHAVTGIGFSLGIAACAAAATQQWTWALVLWLLNRFADGLDGSIARRTGPTDLGGFLDIMADFAIYGTMLVAIGYALPVARRAPCRARGAAHVLPVGLGVPGMVKPGHKERRNRRWKKSGVPARPRRGF